MVENNALPPLIKDNDTLLERGCCPSALRDYFGGTIDT